MGSRSDTEVPLKPVYFIGVCRVCGEATSEGFCHGSENNVRLPLVPQSGSAPSREFQAHNERLNRARTLNDWIESARRVETERDRLAQEVERIREDAIKKGYGPAGVEAQTRAIASHRERLVSALRIADDALSDVTRQNPDTWQTATARSKNALAIVRAALQDPQNEGGQ